MYEGCLLRLASHIQWCIICFQSLTLSFSSPQPKNSLIYLWSLGFGYSHPYKPCPWYREMVLILHLDFQKPSHGKEQGIAHDGLRILRDLKVGRWSWEKVSVIYIYFYLYRKFKDELCWLVFPMKEEALHSTFCTWFIFKIILCFARVSFGWYILFSSLTLTYICHSGNYSYTTLCYTSIVCKTIYLHFWIVIYTIIFF